MTTLLKLGLLMEDFNMKILYALILSMSVIIANAQEPGGTYEDFLASQNLSAKEYILSLFKNTILSFFVSVIIGNSLNTI